MKKYLNLLLAAFAVVCYSACTKTVDFTTSEWLKNTTWVGTSSSKTKVIIDPLEGASSIELEFKYVWASLDLKSPRALRYYYSTYGENVESHGEGLVRYSYPYIYLGEDQEHPLGDVFKAIVLEIDKNDPNTLYCGDFVLRRK